MQGDFGQSSVNGRDVWPDLVTAMSYTFPLALVSLALGLAVSVPLALIATRRPGSWLDRGAVALASVGVAIPAFWLGLLLILLFAVQLGWLPAMGAETTTHSILPAMTLGFGVTASLTRIIRSGILEARGQPPMPEWGTMLLDARIHMRSTPLQMIWPGLCVVVSVLAINLAGNALRDALAEQDAKT